MTDFTYGQGRSPAYTGASFDEAITLSMDFWTLSFNFNILTASDPSGYGNSSTQAALNKIIEVISQRGQPVILNNPTFNATTGVSTLIFAIEHKLSWNTNEGTAPVYGLGAAGAATDSGVASLKAALLAGLVNVTYQYSGETGSYVVGGGDSPVYNAWAAGTIAAGTVVSANSNYYICVVGGTATTGNAPTGTGTTGTVAITTGDGLVWWYLAPTSAGTPPSVQYLVGTPVYGSILP